MSALTPDCSGSEGTWGDRNSESSLLNEISICLELLSPNVPAVPSDALADGERGAPDPKKALPRTPGTIGLYSARLTIGLTHDQAIFLGYVCSLIGSAARCTNVDRRARAPSGGKDARSALFAIVDRAEIQGLRGLGAKAASVLDGARSQRKSPCGRRLPSACRGEVPRKSREFHDLR
jgi:hypothetical protein